jgi:hypothetical protein
MALCYVSKTQASRTICRWFLLYCRRWIVEDMNKTIYVIREDEDERYVTFNFDAEGWNKRLSNFNSFPLIQL